MDGVGTTRRLVTSGNTAWDQYSLDAFGADRGSWTNYHNPYRFGGAWGYITDTPGSGLLQLGARFYWPELGRFITQDPLRVRWNRYAYAGSNPILRIDPKGLKDIYFPLEADVATPWGGIEASVGIVIDTDDWLHESGVFSSSGPAKGPNFGLGGGAGVAEEIEGYVDSVDVDFALLSVSWPFEEDWRDARGVAVTIGPGAGASVSHTVTRTTTLPCIWASLQRAGRWLRDLF
jgi:RHS repeat-associated protein